MSRRPSWRRMLAYAGATLGLLAALGITLRGTLLNHFAKARLERGFAQTYPGCSLKIGEFQYAFGANCLSARTVTLQTAQAVLTVEQASLAGVGWPGLAWDPTVWVEALAGATLTASNLAVTFPGSPYQLRCARLRASGPLAELVLEGTELQPSVDDESFFAAHPHRAPRLHLLVPECRVEGLAFSDLLQGRGYRAKAVHVASLSFDSLVNRDKPRAPSSTSPLMLHEALAAIRHPLRIDSLTLTNGRVTYSERPHPGAEPAVLTFGAVSASVEGLANRGTEAATLTLRAQGDLMDDGTLKVVMSIPLQRTDFSLRYSGTLGPMDLTRLDGFLEISEHVRIKSGSAREAAFEIDVGAGEARGRVRAIYENLAIAVLDGHTGTERGFGPWIKSLLANALTVRNANAPEGAGSRKEGQVNYSRQPTDEFLQYVWFALRTGLLDLISN